MGARLEYFRTTANCKYRKPMMFRGGGNTPTYACSECGILMTTIYDPHQYPEPEPMIPMAEYLPQLARVS